MKAPSTQPLLRAPALLLPFSLALLALTACGRSPQTEPAAEATAQPAPAVAEASQAEADRAAALAAKEKEIADREAAVQQREIEQQLAQRAAEAEAEAAAARAARSKATVAKKQPASAEARCGRGSAASFCPRRRLRRRSWSRRAPSSRSNSLRR